VGGNHDDGQPGQLGEQRFEEVEARFVAEPQVDQGHVERLPLGLPKGIEPIRRFLDRMPHRLHRYSKRPADIRLVIDNQDPHGRTISRPLSLGFS
jgi:hypothetical protein